MSVVARVVVLVVLGGLLAPPAADAGKLPPGWDLTLRGEERDHMEGAVEIEDLVAHGRRGARLVLHETVECDLRGAHCERLHRRARARGCEDTYGRGWLRLPGGVLRLRTGGVVCPGVHDHEHGLALVTAARGRLRGTRALLRYRIVKTVLGDGRQRDVVRLWRPGARAAGSPDCVMCEYVSHLIHQDLADGFADHQIEQRLRALAASMPFAHRVRCATIVDRHVRALIALARERLPAEEACRQVGICAE